MRRPGTPLYQTTRLMSNNCRDFHRIMPRVSRKMTRRTGPKIARFSVRYARGGVLEIESGTSTGGDRG